MTLDRNLAALLRQDAHTVHVAFNDEEDDQPLVPPLPDNYMAKNFKVAPRSPKTYTYVAEKALHLQEGDYVIVLSNGTHRVARIAAVDDEVEIEPDEQRDYLWVIDRVDMTRHQANMKRNAEIVSLVAGQKKHAMREAFRQMAISSLGGRAAALLGTLQPKPPAASAPVEPPTYREPAPEQYEDAYGNARWSDTNARVSD